jgi:hypothetical protein
MQAAYLSGIQTSPDNATYTSAPGITSAKLQSKGETTEITALGGAGAQNKLMLMQDGSVAITGDYVNGNVGQSNMLFNEGGVCYVKVFLGDGTFILFPGIVESYGFSVDGTGKVSFNVTISLNAAITQGSAATPTDTPLPSVNPGYNATLKMTGTSTSTTGEAFTLVSGKTYQVTSTAKRIIDPGVAITVKDNGGAVAASNILSYDYLFGKVTFIPGYTVLGAITADYSYLPTVAIAETRQFKLAVKNKLLDKTSLDSAGVKQRGKGTKEASGSFGSLTMVTATVGAGTLLALTTGRTPIVLEMNLGVGNKFRVWSYIPAQDVTLKPDSIIESGFTWESLVKGATGSESSFGWGT